MNPSWNLGVAEASADHVVISNDDILFPPPLLDAVADRLGPKVGLIGPHTSCLSEANSRHPAFFPAHERTPGYGVLMFCARADWVPIPDDLLVWCGDDFQFGRQTKRNYWFTRTRVETRMGLTSRRPEFASTKAADLGTYRARYAADAPYFARFGREAAVVNGVRSLVRRVRGRQDPDA